MAKKNVKNKQTTARVEVFRPGTFTSMSGEQVSYTAADLVALAKSYDPKNFPAPAVVGHPTHDSPAYAWVTGFEYDEGAERLYADLNQIEPEFSENVKDGRYKRISMSFFKPDSDANPKKGAIYPKHVGFLGGAAPAVSGLAPVSFKGNDDDAITIEFGESAFRDVAGVFQKLRDFIIDQFDIETADQAVPSYLVNWIDDAADSKDDNFTSPKKDDTMSGKDDKKQSDDFAEREAALDARAQKIAEQESARTHDGNVAFVDGLISDGKLITGLKPKVIALMDGIGADDDVDDLSYVDGDDTKKASALTLLKDVLSAQAKIVDFTATDLGDDEPVDTGDGEALGAAAASYIGEMKAKGIDVSATDAVEYVEKQGTKS